MRDYQKILDHIAQTCGTAEDRGILASYIPELAFVDNKNKMEMHDEAGEFAFEVGLPGKSGVGGGIVALLPNKFCVATWSPGLNPKGNSQLGMVALEKLTTQSGQSIF